ncbi:Non-reducing end alpha-L-arabinofuranosidase BoGH43B [Colletotrichum viniferum]|nr:Non-reducing end alpha-L-arabinofuranosidase BoGH43B [Colletotrichum viniferum]
MWDDDQDLGSPDRILGLRTSERTCVNDPANCGEFDRLTMMMLSVLKYLLTGWLVCNEISSAQAGNSTFYNPVLPGWHSDPSCVQVDEIFYCITSSFITFPGLPIYASKDLTNWKLISHAWSREAEMPGTSQQTKGQQEGFYAATIRHRNGQFWVICEFLGLPDGVLGTIFKTNDPYYNAAWEDPITFPTPAGDLDLFWDDDGKLYIPGGGQGTGLLPRQDVLAARESYFASLSPSGILKPGTTPKEGIFDPEANPSNYPGIGAGAKRTTATAPGSQDKREMFMDAALKAHTDEWYCGSTDTRVPGFCNHPALKAFVAHFTCWGDNTLPVKRTLLRNNTPGNKAIGVHYDQPFMGYGEPTAVTAWVLIGDVSLEGGGLIYLEDGEALGAEIEQDFEQKANAAGMNDEE